MAHFPNTFAEEVLPLGAVDLGERGNAALEIITEKGYVVVAGLTRFLGGQVSGMARQKHIREYCYKDPTEKRFGTEASTEQWLGKGGGRGMLLLAKMLDKPDAIPTEKNIRSVGYGWEGAETSKKVPGAQTTFAVRVAEEGLDQKLAKPFSTVILAASAVLYDARQVWLETWESNLAADMYDRIGFVKVEEANEAGQRKTASGALVSDIRLFKSYPDELLPPYNPDALAA